jgi:hypothetical protein
VALEPGRTQTVELPLDLAAFGEGKAVDMELAFESRGLTLTTACRRPLIACPRAPSAASVDGDLGEWASLPAQIKPHMLTWAYVNAREAPGPEDLSVTGWVAYDERGLWIVLRVKDDTPAFPQSRAVWNWDSLQVGLDLAGDAHPDGSYDANDLEIELALKPGGDPPRYLYLGYCPDGWPQEQLSAQLLGAVRPDAEPGTVAYELLVPAALLVSTISLEPEVVIGFSLMVNDNDGQGRAGWQELTPGIGLGKHPWQFAWLWLR